MEPGERKTYVPIYGLVALARFGKQLGIVRRRQPQARMLSHLNGLRDRDPF
jgi:hypothetical protein